MRAKLGHCLLSRCDVIELMQNKDCMCLGLSITRIQGTIQDPAKVFIKDVYPVFMGTDRFLESSIYKFHMNQDDEGGFDLRDEGKLAIEAGLENISGLLPLYLFKEHWELAMLKSQPLFGFMCSFEPSEFTFSQFYTIPFQVLMKVLEKSIVTPSELNTKILEVVHETCWNIVAANYTFKDKIMDTLKAFIKNPLNRTVDVVNDI